MSDGVTASSNSGRYIVAILLHYHKHPVIV
jgi:hypothetical protein